MKRFVIVALLAATAWLSVAPAAEAAVFLRRGGYRYGGYRGGYYGGVRYGRGVGYNPYTGRAGAYRYVYNPATGGYEYRYVYAY
jgi:hypothetical protein